MSEVGKFGVLIRELREQETLIMSEADKLRTELKQKELELKQVQGAVAHLAGKPSNKAPKPRKTGRPAPNKLEVEKAVFMALQENPTLSEAALRKEVEATLDDGGFSKMGLTLRFREVLQTVDLKSPDAVTSDAP